MKITLTQSLTLPVPCANPLTIKAAHLIPVGFLSVRGAATGDPCLGRSRSMNETNVRTRMTATGVYGTRGSVAQGSQAADALVPASAKASGVPPRGRPV